MHKPRTPNIRGLKHVTLGLAKNYLKCWKCAQR